MAWGVFGDDDRVGTLNFLTAERVRHAATLVRTGSVFPLNWRLEVPDPPMFDRRLVRHGTKIFPTGTDDWYDDFYPQASTQWDALSHIGHPQVGYHGGRAHDAVRDPSTNPLGIEVWARRGIAGRFVLLDIGRQRAARGSPLDMESSIPIDVAELESTLHDEGVELLGGDILLLRFGWITWYEGADADTRARVPRMGDTATPGLSQDESMAEWLWNQRIAAVVADNPGVERYPSAPDDLSYFLHFRLITFLGMAVGELFDLDRLAADCAADGPTKDSS